MSYQTQHYGAVDEEICSFGAIMTKMVSKAGKRTTRDLILSPDKTPEPDHGEPAG